MQGVITHKGELLILQGAFVSGGTAMQAVIGLYDSITPNPSYTSKLADLTESTFTGYAETDNLVPTPIADDPAGRVNVYIVNQATFTAGAIASPTNIRGVFWKDHTSSLLVGLADFDAPVVLVNNGDKIQILSLSLRDDGTVQLVYQVVYAP